MLIQLGACVSIHKSHFFTIFYLSNFFPSNFGNCLINLSIIWFHHHLHIQHKRRKRDTNILENKIEERHRENVCGKSEFLIIFINHSVWNCCLVIVENWIFYFVDGCVSSWNSRDTSDYSQKQENDENKISNSLSFTKRVNFSTILAHVNCTSF